ncbi:MAG: hypothetical protein IPM64_10505 [Phycisphaerales bacterium]|nr:hypothetical protein [Phycisphaerales bacterium]
MFPETIRSPLFFQKSHGLLRPSEDQLYLECVLARGDVLYCPRGHWHEALASKESSLHLTLALFWRTGVDLLSWIADELRDNEVLRQSFPPVLKSEIPADGALHPATYDHYLKVREAIVGMLDRGHEVMNAFLTHNIATQKNRCPFAFPYHLPDESVQLTSTMTFDRPARRARLVVRNDTSCVELVAAGKLLIRFMTKAVPALQFIFSRDTFTRNELVSRVTDLSEDDISDILSVLTKEGVIIPRANCRD